MPVPILVPIRYPYLRPVRVSGTHAIAYMRVTTHVDGKLPFIAFLQATPRILCCVVCLNVRLRRTMRIIKVAGIGASGLD